MAGATAARIAPHEQPFVKAPPPKSEWILSIYDGYLYIFGGGPMSIEDMPAGGAGDGEPGYAAAMAELEQILEELEGEDPDVDVLADRVERAATLIEVCRRRITNASIQVERVVAALESDGST